MKSGATKIMGIINLNADSFYAPSRAETADAFRHRADELLARGVDILDLGAVSSRPGSEEVDAETEWERRCPLRSPSLWPSRVRRMHKRSSRAWRG